MAGTFSKIVVAYDGSELSKKALNKTIKMAGENLEAIIHVVTVVEPLKIYDYHMELSYDQIRKQHEKEIEEMMEEINQQLDNIPNETKLVELKGYPSKMIIEYAQQNNADLIIMGSRGLSNIKELFLGSVSHNVVQQSPIPVLIVK